MQQKFPHAKRHEYITTNWQTTKIKLPLLMSLCQIHTAKCHLKTVHNHRPNLRDGYNILPAIG